MLPPAGRREPCRLIRVAGAMGERRPRRASLLHRLVFSRQQADPHRELSRTRRGPRSRRAVGVPTAQRRWSGNALETADRSNTRGRWFETSRAHRPDGRRNWFLHTTRIPTRSKPAAPIVRMAAGLVSSHHSHPYSFETSRAPSSGWPPGLVSSHHSHPYSFETSRAHRSSSWRVGRSPPLGLAGLLALRTLRDQRRAARCLNRRERRRAMRV
jgi:hypothetical protein